jgi:histidinol-phosphatase (PHP family)
MLDFHMHSRLSFDSEGDPGEMVAAAQARGLREICFTDHFDLHERPDEAPDIFTFEELRATYAGIDREALAREGLTVRIGVECGLTLGNRAEIAQLLGGNRFDFVIGSVHFTDGYDIYYPDFWRGKTTQEAFRRYLEHTLDCVRLHNDFDVLGHLNYVCKCPPNTARVPLRYADHAELVDEILRTLAAKGKGIEVNTSGVDAVGTTLPDGDFLRRFRELGGEIVTVGSDAHAPARVGQHVDAALELIGSVFGCVYTFADRTPIRHAL